MMKNTGSIKITKENISKVISNMGLSFLPPQIGVLVNTIEDIKTDEELKNKFEELKKYAENIKREVTSMPISVEIKIVSVVVIYLNAYLDNDVSKELKERLDEMNDDISFDGMIEDFIMESDAIAINLSSPSLKENVDEFIIEDLRTVLSEYDLEIRAIACF